LAAAVAVALITVVEAAVVVLRRAGLQNLQVAQLALVALVAALL
jgi:hypothetical protein